MEFDNALNAASNQFVRVVVELESHCLLQDLYILPDL